MLLDTPKVDGRCSGPPLGRHWRWARTRRTAARTVFFSVLAGEVGTDSPLVQWGVRTKTRERIRLEPAAKATSGKEGMEKRLGEPISRHEKQRHDGEQDDQITSGYGEDLTKGLYVRRSHTKAIPYRGHTSRPPRQGRPLQPQEPRHGCGLWEGGAGGTNPY